MCGAELSTERLRLRPLNPADAEAIADGLDRWEVTQWLALPPWPYRLDHAVDFLAAEQTGVKYAIVLKDEGPTARLRGMVSISEEGSLGYWLHPEVKGRGVMREAASRVVREHFAQSDAPLSATVQVENTASERILHWLGFVEIARAPKFSRIRGHDTTDASLSLSAQAWRLSPAYQQLSGADDATSTPKAQREAASQHAAKPLEGN